MNVKNHDGSLALVELTSNEIITINNALNELCNGIGLPEWEFQSRVGCTVQEARLLLPEIGQTAVLMKRAN